MADKDGISSLDLMFLKKELLSALAGGVFKKIYHYKYLDNYQFIFEIYVPSSKQEKNFWLYVDKSKIFLTNTKKEAGEPTSFCMFLRKHLSGQKIRDIRQYKFDRVLEIVTDDNILVFEFFSTGNVILCDTFSQIIFPLHMQRWKDREIRSKIAYKHPPSNYDPLSMKLDDLRSLSAKTEKSVGHFLATTLGFGGFYSDEICSVSGVDPKKQSNQLSLEDLANIHKTISGISKSEMQPIMYESFVSPFHLKEKKGKEFQTLSEAFEEFYTEKEEKKVEEIEKKAAEKIDEKQQKILESREKAVEKFERRESESKEIADLIYTNYMLVDDILKGIRNAKSNGKSWDDIKSAIRNEDTPEANAVKEINEGEGTVTVSIGGKEVILDFRKTVEENAASYYNDVKTARSKKEGAVESLSKVVELEKPKTTKRRPVRRGKWYEKFRWFFSSHGMLVIAGRDAASNEKVVKKHAEENDLLFHADIQGAAFTLIKPEGKSIDPMTEKEASEFAAANSKAWSKNIGTIDVYSFKPSQATKPVSLPKGSFVIEGARKWYKDLEMKLSVGVQIDREKETAKVISGPVMSVRSHSTYFVTIKPGYKESLELSRDIKNKILLKSRPEDRYLIDNLPLEDFQKCIPSGKGDIEEGTGL